MSAHVQHVKQVGRDGLVTTRTTRVEDETDVRQADTYSVSVAARIVWYVAGVLLTVLAFRFVLALLGANQANQFAHFVYSISHPFVAPFFSLFGYNLQYGVSHFEVYTLVAMFVYTVIAFGISRLMTLNRDAKLDSQVE